MSNIFDVALVGIGMAGSICTYKLSKEHKDLKIIAFDWGRPPQKRRSSSGGFLGWFPGSNGQLFQNDLKKVTEICGPRKTKVANSWFQDLLSNINDFKIIKDKAPSSDITKKLKELDYSIQLNNYIQMFPKDIHALSKFMNATLEKNDNLHLVFDTEIQNIYKHRGVFTIIDEHGQEYKAKKVIVAVGRSGWRWAKKLFSDLDIIDNNDTARFGIRVELNAELMRHFNQSHCTLTKKDELEIGPLSWFGTIIPEDNGIESAISNFRGNEDRWITDKISFSLIGNRHFPGTGFEETDRLGKLTFILTNDRIAKERISHLLTKKSKISILKEYDWLRDVVVELNDVIPGLINKGHFHIPTLQPYCPMVNLSKNLETEIDGLYVAGESANIPGLLGAAVSGCVIANAISK